MSSKIFKNVVIHKSEDGGEVYISNEPMPLTIGFNPNQIIGESNLREKNGIVYADIEIFDADNNLPSFAEHMFPYVGGRNIGCGFRVESTAIGPQPNVDPGILKMGDYITAAD